jgi:hypothetical protein
MQLLLCSIGLEILGLTAALFYDLFRIPFIIGILLHIGAAYLFTRGIEPWLKKLRLTREVCFLLSFFIPVYGMISILFQIFVLRRIKIIRNIIREGGRKIKVEEPKPTQVFLFENDYIGDLLNTNIMKLHYDCLPEGDRVLSYNYFAKANFEKLAKEYKERIRELENKSSQNTADKEISKKLVSLYIEYASKMETEKIAKQRYLMLAKNLGKDLLKKDPTDFKMLAHLMEIHFLLGETSDCLKLAKKILSKDQIHEQAVMRLAECYYLRHDYKKIRELSSQVKRQVKKPKDLEYFTEMWAANG